MSISEEKFYENITTIRTNRYGSEIRNGIWENLDYLKEHGGGGGGSGLSWVKCTQAEYDAMSSHDPNTLYIIVEAETTEVSEPAGE